MIVSSLHEFLADEDDLDEVRTANVVSESVPWHIDGLNSAEWAMGKYAAAEEAIAAAVAQAQEWRAPLEEKLARVDAWLESATADAKRTRAFFSAHLQRYALEVREADPNRKSIKLPSGTVSTTAKGPVVKVTDEDQALAWAAQHAPDAVKAVPHLLVSVLREHVKVVELVTFARVTHSCGDIIDVDDEEGLHFPEVGSEVECPGCKDPVLLGNVEVLATRLLAQTTEGGFVPGVDVEPGTVTAKVVVA